MTITLTPEIEQALAAQARELETTPENVVLTMLRERLKPSMDAAAQVMSLEPRDEWERLLFSLAVDCGVSLSNEALSSEDIYD